MCGIMFSFSNNSAIAVKWSNKTTTAFSYRTSEEAPVAVYLLFAPYYKEKYATSWKLIFQVYGKH